MRIVGGISGFLEWIIGGYGFLVDAFRSKGSVLPNPAALLRRGKPWLRQGSAAPCGFLGMVDCGLWIVDNTIILMVC